MKFNVNFYIHLYNSPIYIIENFINPMRNVHLSYHEGVNTSLSFISNITTV